MKNLKIPWVAEGRYARGYLTVGIAKGGVGKTMLLFTDLIGISLGEDLLNFGTKIEKSNTWLHSTEDDDVDLKRRAIGAALAHELEVKDLGGFFLSSGRKKNLKIAIMANNQPIANTPHINAIKKTIKDNKIGVFVLDPFSGCHGLSENDNTHMVMVKDILNDIAEECRCSVVVVHHSRKKNGKGGHEVEDARGASALTDGARTVLVFNEMTEEEGTKLSVKNYTRFVQINFVKSNNAPPELTRPIWFEKKSFQDKQVGTVGAAVAWSPLCNELVEDDNGRETSKNDIIDSGNSGGGDDWLDLSPLPLPEGDSASELLQGEKAPLASEALPEDPDKIARAVLHDAIDDGLTGLNKMVAADEVAKRLKKHLPTDTSLESIRISLLRRTKNGRVIDTKTIKIKRARDGIRLVVF